MNELTKVDATPTPYYIHDTNEHSLYICRKWDSDHTPANSATYGSYLGAHIAEIEYGGEGAVPTKEQALANAQFIVDSCNAAAQEPTITNNVELCVCEHPKDWHADYGGCSAGGEPNCECTSYTPLDNYTPPSASDVCAEWTNPIERQTNEYIARVVKNAIEYAATEPTVANDLQPVAIRMASMMGEVMRVTISDMMGLLRDYSNEAVQPPASEPMVINHVCEKCGARWINNQDGTWKLRPGSKCGPCCDNHPMPAQPPAQVDAGEVDNKRAAGLNRTIAAAKGQNNE